MPTKPSLFISLTAAAAIGAGLALTPVLAGATAKDEYLGKADAEIRAALEQDGYEVRKIETEDGYLEAYAMRDGQRFEIYVDPESGKVVKIEEDD